MQALRGASAEGLDPSHYPVAEIDAALARMPDPDARQWAERVLTAAFAQYAHDLLIPSGQNATTFVDAELAPQMPDISMLAASTSPVESLLGLQRHNVLYNDLRTGLGWYREHFGSLPQDPISSGPALRLGSVGQRVAQLRLRLGLSTASGQPQRFDEALGRAVQDFRRIHGLAPAPVADAATIDALNAGAEHYEKLIAANMDRTRGLPGDGRRYIVVDVAGAQLKMIADGQQVDEMRVVVGKRDMKTPEMAGLIRFAMVNPYWNVPPDLVRNSIAPDVIRKGPSELERRRLALFSDWSSYDRLPPEQINWRDVAAGRADVWVRQLPGGDNMMGKVKFMLPNNLGIYLHDTPLKFHFEQSDRWLSSGCVRLQDAPRLARWLFGGASLPESDAVDVQIDLPQPVPVYITYLTAVRRNGEIVFQNDVYGRDRDLVAQLANPVTTQG